MEKLTVTTTNKGTYKKNTAISLDELDEIFPNEEAARRHLEEQRWHGIPTCTHCGSQRSSVWWVARPGYYRCKDCRTKYCVKTGTIFADTKIPLRKWMKAFYFMVTARKGISSVELGKLLRISQKSAWLLEQKIREAMGGGEYDYMILKDEVEVDETYVGGTRGNKHWNKKGKIRGTADMAKIMGIVERNGRLCVQVVPDTKKTTLQSIIVKRVERGSTVNTDEYRSYIGVGNLGYKHQAVNHGHKIYKTGNACTNTIESVWANLKRGIIGIWHHVSVKHLQRYANEFQFRWNEGNCRYETMDRINSLIGNCWGRMLPYKVLIA
jgi:transposase-like protein